MSSTFYFDHIHVIWKVIVLFKNLYTCVYTRLFLHTVIQLLDGVKAGLEPPVLLALLSKQNLQLAHLVLVFLVRQTSTQCLPQDENLIIGALRAQTHDKECNHHTNNPQHVSART